MIISDNRFYWWANISESADSVYEFSLSAFKVQDNKYALPQWVFTIQGLPVDVQPEVLGDDQHAHDHVHDIAREIYDRAFVQSRSRKELLSLIAQGLKSLWADFEDTCPEIFESYLALESEAV